MSFFSDGLLVTQGKSATSLAFSLKSPAAKLLKAPGLSVLLIPQSHEADSLLKV
jgi:hypothetical protein